MKPDLLKLMNCTIYVADNLPKLGGKVRSQYHIVNQLNGRIGRRHNWGRSAKAFQSCSLGTDRKVHTVCSNGDRYQSSETMIYSSLQEVTQRSCLHCK